MLSRSFIIWVIGSMVKNLFSETLQTWMTSWRTKLSTYRMNHPSDDFPVVTKQQLDRPLQPLLPNTIATDATFVAVQRVFQLPFSIRLYLVKESPIQASGFWGSFTSSFSHSLRLTHTSTLSSATPESLHTRSAICSESFKQRFNHIFDLSSFSTRQQQAAQAAISNLIGSISFFAGETVQIGSDGQRVPGRYGTLFTAIPGRSYFPRGFVWDEGFHQLVVSEWNTTLTLQILRSWLNRMEESVVIE